MITGKYFIKNSAVLSSESFSDPFEGGTMSIYEVVRTDDGIPLFLEDHIERLEKSFTIASKKLIIHPVDLTSQILRLISMNNMKNGLLRIVFCFLDNNHTDVCIYQSTVTFPSDNDYHKGLSCELLSAERKSPSAKIYNPTVREKANRIIDKHKVYETILVNSENRITEGSRSNIFFIKGNSITTAPDNTVLSGITRKKVIGIINDLSITLKYDLPEINDLKDIDAVFLTGTTPKVLPVREIEKMKFKTDHPLISKISLEYDRITESYKKNFRKYQ